jgi:hypothetical protein
MIEIRIIASYDAIELHCMIGIVFVIIIASMLTPCLPILPFRFVVLDMDVLANSRVLWGLDKESCILTMLISRRPVRNGNMLRLNCKCNSTPGCALA